MSATNTRNKLTAIKATGIPITNLIISNQFIIIEPEQMRHILGKDKEQNQQ